MDTTIESLYVPALAPALKHSTVFKKFDDLQKGESFLLVNDHDPIPLYYELKAERGETFKWNKIENGPDIWKVEITKTAGAKPLQEQNATQEETGSNEVFVLNVTTIEPRLKHPTIFKHFDELQPGQAFQILNDHDPKPLYYQLIAERGPIFSWKYIQKGPQWWQVQIVKNNADSKETIGSIVAKDIRKAEVFKKYGIDFCCGGKKSVKEACAEANVEATVVENALKDFATDTKPTVDFERWDADFLADYVCNQHHKYYYDEAPVIADLLNKVVNRHGNHYPELLQVYTLYNQLQDELNFHFRKEESVLFPFIKALANAKKTGDLSGLKQFASLAHPVEMMEADHEVAGKILAELRKVTNNFITPPNACNSFKFLYSKLEALENDLHIHVHLENNILFPKALAIEKALRN